MATTIPASVSRRKRLILAGDIFLGLAIVAAALHFFALGVSNLLWPIAGIAATTCTNVAAPVHSAPRRSHYGNG